MFHIRFYYFFNNILYMLIAHAHKIASLIFYIDTSFLAHLSARNKLEVTIIYKYMIFLF